MRQELHAPGAPCASPGSSDQALATILQQLHAPAPDSSDQAPATILQELNARSMHALEREPLNVTAM